MPLAIASERSRTSQRTLLLTAALAALLLYLVAATAGPSSALGATTTTRVALCSANLRTTAIGLSRVKKTIGTGTLVTVVAAVTGRSYRTTCAGRSVSSKTWLRVSRVDGKSVKTLFGVSYVYAASTLFKTVPVSKYAACALNLRSSPKAGATTLSRVKTGTKLAVVATVSGRGYDTTCAGKAVKGSTWAKVNVVNGKSVKSLFGVRYVYVAAKLLVSAPTPTPVPTPTPPAGGGAIDHVVVVWLENEEATAITSSSMPYLYGLSTTYGRADQFYAVSHPSLPNYLAFWSGSTQGVTDDGTYNLSAASLSSQMAAAGRSWRTYAQDYPATGCNLGSTYSGGVDGPGVAGTYARKHNPAMSFTSVSGTAQCANIQPLARFDPSVNVAFVVPNLCNDAHDCSLATADTFLKGFVPWVTGAPDWAHTLLVISFDEGSTSTNGGGRIFTAVMRPGLSGVVSTTQHTHYSLLRTIENLNGLPCLANSCSANTLNEFLP